MCSSPSPSEKKPVILCPCYNTYLIYNIYYINTFVIHCKQSSSLFCRTSAECDDTITPEGEGPRLVDQGVGKRRNLTNCDILVILIISCHVSVDRATHSQTLADSSAKQKRVGRLCSVVATTRTRQSSSGNVATFAMTLAMLHRSCIAGCCGQGTSW